MALATALDTFWRSSMCPPMLALTRCFPVRDLSVGIGLEATAVPGLCPIKGNREDALPNSTLRAIRHVVGSPAGLDGDALNSYAHMRR
ncbi:hypothetical protein E4U61_006287 [Claviceps capensis]|nr:hypothetical protein E4U61_006287 [Claviceps capensis]